jgi:hypothetical protein
VGRGNLRRKKEKARDKGGAGRLPQEHLNTLQAGLSERVTNRESIPISQGWQGHVAMYL